VGICDTALRVLKQRDSAREQCGFPTFQCFEILISFAAA
jgi:hypothetical protein